MCLAPTLRSSEEADARQRQGDCNGNRRSEGVRCTGNGTTSFCVGKVSVGAEMEEEAMRERMKEWIYCVCCECDVKGMEHEAGKI